MRKATIHDAVHPWLSKDKGTRRVKTVTEFRETHRERSSERCTLPYLALGVAGEAGEIADLLKKNMREEGPEGGVSEKRRMEIIGEAGDLLWYLDALLDRMDCTMIEAMQLNDTKLMIRNANGVEPGKTGKHMVQDTAEDYFSRRP